MGNVSGAGIISRRRQGSRRTHPPPPPPQLPHPEIASNRYVYPGGVVPYNVQYPNTNPNFNPPPPGFYQYPPGYYPPPPPGQPPAMPVPLPYDHHHPHGPPPPHIDPAHQAHANWPGGRYPCGPMMSTPTPYVEHQKAMTIRNDVNLKKETLKVEMDENDPGKYLVTFTFDATVAGSITLIFFAKEIENCQLKPLKETSLPPVKVEFQAGLAQKFIQPSGTGIDLSIFEESELLKEGEMDVYPLAVKAETLPLPLPQPTPAGTESEPHTKLVGDNVVNAQITQAVFEKERGKYQVKVIKQILWVNSTRYELQEIYGIGNSVEHDSGGDGNDAGKECVICLSEPRDTTVLPCRHMCMCSGCAKVLRFQTNRCPICRQPVERLLEIKVSNSEADEGC